MANRLPSTRMMPKIQIKTYNSNMYFQFNDDFYELFSLLCLENGPG